MSPKRAEAPKMALLIVDLQESLFSVVEKREEVLRSILRLAKAFQLLDLPIYLTEQYPKGLGSTLSPLRDLLGKDYQPFKKSSFSCLDDPFFFEKLKASSRTQWVVVGLEAHICILLTVKSMLQNNLEPIVPLDAITSRSLLNYSTAIAEMRDEGARITSSETLLFELVGGSQHPDFKAIQNLVRKKSGC